MKACIFILGVLMALAGSAAGEAPRTAPYPPSDAIASIDFAATSTITRRAIGSDNWPVTWADDDALYTSYGDGWGFEPKIGTKLSQGFAKMLGVPPDFRAINIRSETGERRGDGKAGPKASGLVMVDGVLYMWVRNTGNATLAWSGDHARRWEWGFRFTESFSCPAFLNFGRNYAGARDEYVYTYSPDGPSAYEPYDHVILARVPKGEVRRREAYEFFAGMNEKGEPAWASDLAARRPVFTSPGACHRIEVVYHPALKRYLMLLAMNHASAWGIFDAPEPWGPWTTAFHTARWDIPGTHGYRLPTKWLSEDGRRAFLAFSGVAAEGYDAFCVREMRITPRLKK